MPTIDLDKLKTRGDRATVQSARTEDVRAALVAYFANVETEFIDFDKIQSMGRFIATTGHDTIDTAAVGWLGERVTPARLDVVSAFLSGLWSALSPGQSLDHDSIATLARLKEQAQTDRKEPDAEYSFALAMGTLLNNGQTTRAGLDTALRSLRDVMTRGTGDPELDKSLATWAPLRIDAASALTGGDVHSTEFRPYACEEGTRRYFVIERSGTHSEAIRVGAPVLEARVLSVDYEIVDSSVGENAARRLIFDKILVGLLNDVYRDQVAEIHYKNGRTGKVTSSPYG